MTIVETRAVQSELLRSVAVTHFRKNPFRLLRLPITVNAQEAVWAAGKLATLRRAGLEPQSHDLLPWLPDADEIDAQEAVQRLEEPLRRLVDQLFWFDLENDGDGSALMRALIASDGAQLSAYLAKNSKVEKGKKSSAPIARRLNAANLRLILGFSALHGTGPVVSLPNATPPLRSNSLFTAAPPPKGKKKAKDAGPSSRVATDVHHQIDPAAEDPYESVWEGLLESGYRAWRELLGERAFAAYVKAQIARAGDELLSADDADTIRRAVATQMADLLVAELKRALGTGRGDRVERLAKIVAAGATEGEEWRHALRSLRPLFTAQLREADILLHDDAGDPLQNLDLYFNRIRGTLGRWRGIDSGGLLELAKLADRAVGDAFDRVEAVVGFDASPHDVRGLLDSARAVATADSLRQRISTFRERYDDFRNYSLCVYCNRRPQTEATGVIAKGLKETRREPMYNGVRIHYATRAALLPRCGPCAQLHKYLDRAPRKLGWAGFFAPMFIYGWATESFGWTLFLSAVTALVAATAGKSIFRSIADHRTDSKDVLAILTPQWQAVAAEGFTLSSVNTSETAMAEWEKE